MTEVEREREIGGGGDGGEGDNIIPNNFSRRIYTIKDRKEKRGRNTIITIFSSINDLPYIGWRGYLILISRKSLWSCSKEKGRIRKRNKKERKERKLVRKVESKHS